MTMRTLLPSLAALNLTHRTQSDSIDSPCRLDAAPYAGLSEFFHRTASIDGTGKRKMDESLAETRLGKKTTLKWARERLRQTMLLIREFRVNWGPGALTDDDMSYVRMCLDSALDQAIKLGHTGNIYDMSPTVWCCWLVQHVFASRSGCWEVESVQQQLRWCISGMYVFLEAIHARGDRITLRDQETREVIHKYRLPFKAMNIPPKREDLFRWKRGAKQLSEWMVATGLPPLHPGIIAQTAPIIVAPPPLLSRRVDRAAALWRRIGERSGQYQLQSVAQGGDDDTRDAHETREVVRAVMGESRAAAAGMSDEAAEDMERELECEMEAEAQGDEDGIPVTAEWVGPPLQPQPQEPIPQREVVWRIAYLLEQMHESDGPELVDD